MVRKKKLTLFLIASAFLGLTVFADKNKNNKDNPKKYFDLREDISRSISSEIKRNSFPHQAKVNLDGNKDEYTIEYTFDEKLQQKAQNLLKLYKPDYGAIFMIDAETGKVLAMASQQKNNPAADNLNLRASFPAASVFKVVTATAAIDYANVEPSHKIAFNGANYTLHKRNVLSDKVNRWTRYITLKDAFARSINTAFGRLTLENLNPAVLSSYAEKFQFNTDLKTDFNVEASQAYVPNEAGYELTQVAAGYNRKNTLSPVHGAMIAASIVNNGKMPTPYIVENIKDEKGSVVYTGKPVYTEPVMSTQSAKKVKSMMEQTVLSGTSRKTFRQMVRDKKFREIEMGGKTGHFTGLNPKGTTDWFVGYATDGETKIAIAAITVNVKKWTVKSSALAQMMFKKYYE